MINTKVLLVEDSHAIAVTFSMRLEMAGYQTDHADTLEKAKLQIEKEDYGVIVMDGCVPGNEYNTRELIQLALAKNPEQLIIAASSKPSIRQQMKTDGCKHISQSDIKADIPDIVAELIPLHK